MLWQAQQREEISPRIWIKYLCSQLLLHIIPLLILTQHGWAANRTLKSATQLRLN